MQQPIGIHTEGAGDVDPAGSLFASFFTVSVATPYIAPNESRAVRVLYGRPAIIVNARKSHLAIVLSKIAFPIIVNTPSGWVGTGTRRRHAPTSVQSST